MSFSELIGATAGTTALGATLLLVLKATTILLVTVGVASVMRRASAGARHVVWLVAIGAVLTLPVLMRWTPLDLRILPAARVATVNNAVTSDAAVVVPDPPASSAPLTQGTTAAPSASSIRMPSPGEMLAIVWGSIALLLLARLAHGTLAVRRIVRDATPLTDDDWNGRLYEVADRLGIARAPRVVRSEMIHVPFATGIVHATIVLPAECDRWTAGQRDAVLIHELGHVSRHDLLGHTLGRIACAVYWFHPLVWTAARRLRDASERACDDLAIRLGSRPSEYAEHLLQIVTATGRPAVPSVALAMAQRREFEGRMLAILDPALRRDAPSRWQSASLTGALAVLSLFVAAAAPAPAHSEPLPVVTVPVTDDIGNDEVGDTLPVASPSPVATPQPAAVVDDGDEVDINIGDALKVKVGERVQVKIGDMVNIDLANEARKKLGEAETSVPLRNPEVLARVLRTDTAANVRRVAAWGLKRHADVPAAHQALRAAATGDADAEVRAMAAWALENSKDAGVVAVMSDVLRRDRDADVRETAAWVLGQSKNAAGAAALSAQLASETSEEVLGTIAWALGTIAPSRAPDRLTALLTSKDEDTRLTAAWALSNIKDKATLPAIRRAMSQPQDESVMRALLRAYVQMDSSPEGLATMIESSDPTVRQAAVEAMSGGGRIVYPWPWPWPRPIPYP